MFEVSRERRRRGREEDRWNWAPAWCLSTITCLGGLKVAVHSPMLCTATFSPPRQVSVYHHLSGWAESGCAQHRAVAVAETGTALQEMPKVLRKAGDSH